MRNWWMMAFVSVLLCGGCRKKATASDDAGQTIDKTTVELQKKLEEALKKP